MEKQKLDRANTIMDLLKECKTIINDKELLGTIPISEELVEVMKDSIKNKMQSLQKEFEEL